MIVIDFGNSFSRFWQHHSSESQLSWEGTRDQSSSDDDFELEDLRTSQISNFLNIFMCVYLNIYASLPYPVGLRDWTQIIRLIGKGLPAESSV